MAHLITAVNSRSSKRVQGDW